MAKEIDLLSYWMPILRQLKEFKEIAKAEEPELRYLLEAIDRTLNNMFIETADEYGIKRFEDMMGIYPEAGATLETRRFNVLVKWNDKVPYTDKELYNRLFSLCGSADKFSIIEHYEEYALEIITHLGVAGSFDTVTSLLQEMLPCNLVLDLKNVTEANKSTPLGIGVVTCTAMSYLITNDISAKVNKETVLNKAVVSSIATAHVVTHDVELEDTVNGTLYNAVGAGVANTQLITNDIEAVATGAGKSTVANPVSTATVITIKS